MFCSQQQLLKRWGKEKLSIPMLGVPLSPSPTTTPETASPWSAITITRTSFRTWWDSAAAPKPAACLPCVHVSSSCQQQLQKSTLCSADCRSGRRGEGHYVHCQGRDGPTYAYHSQDKAAIYMDRVRSREQPSPWLLSDITDLALMLSVVQASGRPHLPHAHSMEPPGCHDALPVHSGPAANLSRQGQGQA